MEKEMEELKILYAQKGELTTKIEIMQNQLGQVNKLIVEKINKPAVQQVKETIKTKKE